MPLQHLTRYVPQPRPYYSPLSTDFSSLNICSPSPIPLSHSRSEEPLVQYPVSQDLTGEFSNCTGNYGDILSITGDIMTLSMYGKCRIPRGTEPIQSH